MRRKSREARIAEAVARLASGIGGADLAFASPTLASAVELVSRRLVLDRGGSLYCRLCNKGPFTPKGLYLHLTRLHQRELASLVDSEVKRISDASKRLKV